MQPKTSIVFGQTERVIIADSNSVRSKDIVINPQQKFRIFQDVVLIWLDENADYCNIMIQMRNVIDTIHIFTDRNQCIDFLTCTNNENVCMIISYELSQNVIPLIHNITQLHTIFVLYNNQIIDQQWMKNWFKIKGVFTESSSLYKAFQQVVRQCEYNTISLSFLSIDGNVSKKNLNQMDPSFMYAQILKEILLSIKFDQNHIKQFVDYCYELFDDNDHQLNKIKEFECRYYNENPVWWYTYEGYLYTMLNRGLRLMNIDPIIKMAFFIKDLHDHLEQLHTIQFRNKHSGDCFTVYRGQGMVINEFNRIKANQSGLFAFNNFLSTSQDREVALLFAESNLNNPDLIGILFIITVDPSQSTTPFATIRGISHFNDEDEVLFSMQTVFRIGNITSIDGNPRLFEVELTLTNDNDKELRQLTDYIREEISQNGEEWHRLALLLYRMGQFDKSEEVYQILLDQTITETEKASIYVHVGLTKTDQGRYKEAIAAYDRAIEIFQKDLPSNNLNLAAAYTNSGEAYRNMDEYPKALSYYEKGLKIKQQLLPLAHPDLAKSYNNIGNAYFSMGEYSQALSYYEKSLEIRLQLLPSNHPNMASSYNNIGSSYGKMGEFTKAIPYIEKTLEIYQQSLPSNHPNLALVYDNLGVIYEIIHNYSKAHSFFECAVNIGQQSLQPNHPDFLKWKNNLERIISVCNKTVKGIQKIK